MKGEGVVMSNPLTSAKRVPVARSLGINITV